MPKSVNIKKLQAFKDLKKKLKNGQSSLDHISAHLETLIREMSSEMAAEAAIEEINNKLIKENPSWNISKEDVSRFLDNRQEITQTPEGFVFVPEDPAIQTYHCPHKVTYSLAVGVAIFGIVYGAMAMAELNPAVLLATTSPISLVVYTASITASLATYAHLCSQESKLGTIVYSGSRD